MKKYKDLLFDADNTVFDFSACEKKSFFESAKRIGIKADDDAYKHYTVFNSMLWEMLERGEIDSDGVQHNRYFKTLEYMGLETELADVWNAEYEEGLAESAILYDDSAECLEKLSKKFRLSMITNGLERVQKSRYQIANLGRYFENRLFISGEIGYSKPDKRFFDFVENSLDGFEKTSALVIGDSLTADIAGAINSGLDAVFIDRNHKFNYVPEGCIARFTSFFELLRYIEAEK